MIQIGRVLAQIPWTHWVLISCVSIVVAMWCWNKKNDFAYGAVALALWVFSTLILLDTLVLRRIGIQIEQHPGFDPVAEYHRLFHGNRMHKLYLFLNLAAFVPFGFLMSEYLYAAKRCGRQRIIRYVTMAAFLFSFSVECMQWILKIGLFELTDMILHTLGALLGSIASLGIRYAFSAVVDGIDLL